MSRVAVVVRSHSIGVAIRVAVLISISVRVGIVVGAWRRFLSRCGTRAGVRGSAVRVLVLIIRRIVVCVRRWSGLAIRACPANVDRDSLTYFYSHSRSGQLNQHNVRFRLRSRPRGSDAKIQAGIFDGCFRGRAIFTHNVGYSGFRTPQGQINRAQQAQGKCDSDSDHDGNSLNY